MNYFIQDYRRLLGVSRVAMAAHKYSIIYVFHYCPKHPVGLCCHKKVVVEIEPVIYFGQIWVLLLRHPVVLMDFRYYPKPFCRSLHSQKKLFKMEPVVFSCHTSMGIIFATPSTFLGISLLPKTIL
jgi:hypothetical protein